MPNALRPLFIALVLITFSTRSSLAQELEERRPDNSGEAVAIPDDSPEDTQANETAVANAVSVAAPLEISFQGYLEDDSLPADGPYDFVFRLKDFPTAGITQWTETQNNVVVTDGIYNVQLGTNTSLAAVDFDDELWLSIEVEGQEILPRPKISASPYSLMSLEALDLRLPASISGTANVDGNKLLTITNQGTGDVLRVQGNSASDGIEVSGVDLNGVEVLSVGGTAFYASNPGGTAFYATSADGNGIHVTDAGDWAFLFQDIPTDLNGNFLTSYVGLIENTGNTTSEDVLALQTGTAGAGTAANLIGFFDGDGDLIGQVEGNGSGGVAYNTSGSDYAEYLPRLTPGESFAGGDIVGVFDGMVSHRTTGAQQVMVITDRAAVLGNAPNSDDVSGYESVSFIGQVPARVKGLVNPGDYIVASRDEDGTAVAVSAEDVTLDQVEHLVGRSWESSSDSGVKRVNVVVGLDRTEVLRSIIRRQDRRLEALEELMEEFLRRDAGS